MSEKRKSRGTRKTPDPRKTHQTTVPTPLSAADLLAKLEGQIKVIHGVNDDTFDRLVGQSVQVVRDALSEAFNILPEALALVNGQPVDGDYILKGNDTLEFLRKSGVCRHKDRPL